MIKSPGKPFSIFCVEQFAIWPDFACENESVWKLGNQCERSTSYVHCGSVTEDNSATEDNNVTEDTATRLKSVLLHDTLLIYWAIIISQSITRDIPKDSANECQ